MTEKLKNSQVQINTFAESSIKFYKKGGGIYRDSITGLPIQAEDPLLDALAHLAVILHSHGFGDKAKETFFSAMIEAEERNPSHIEPGWYWVCKVQWGGDTYGDPVPAEYRADVRAWYSTDFGGVPSSQLIIGERLDAKKDK